MTASGSNLEFVACDHCDTPFDVEERYPVVVTEDADGNVELYSFCDEACQQTWTSENREALQGSD